MIYNILISKMIHTHVKIEINIKFINIEILRKI